MQLFPRPSQPRTPPAVSEGNKSRGGAAPLRRLPAGRVAPIVLVLMVILVVASLLAGCSAAIGSANDTSSTAQKSAASGGAAGGSTSGDQTRATATAPVSLAVADTPVSLGESPAELVAALVSPSVVHVRVSGTTTTPFYGDQPYEGVGSGVIFSSDGYIITNDHVVSQNGQPSDDIEVTFATGEVVPATIVGRDSYTDIAVIKVDKTGLPAAAFARTEDISIGEYAIAIGSPMDYRNSVTLGIVSGLGRTIEGSGSSSLVDLVQVDAAISPGNSGGAVLDASGSVIGIAVAYLPPQQTGAENIGFAIPVDTAVSVAQELIATGSAKHPYMGIQYMSVDSTLQRQYRLSRSSGVLIAEVGGGTPAAQAGIQRGDIIISIDGEPIAQEGEVVMALREKKAGDVITVTVDRDGQELTLEVTLAERPATVTE